jgi:hypothetical protein
MWVAGDKLKGVQMNKPRKPVDIKECKIQASILLKSLHSKTPEIAKNAAKRFQCLPEFMKLSSAEIIQSNIKRKHALMASAIENGFKSWIDLKIQMPFIRGGFLNKWFAHYPEANSHLQSNGGFLLPYKNHFFICDANYIKYLGLEPDNLDWQLIGYDWEHPNDKNAWQRLYKKWMKVQQDI